MIAGALAAETAVEPLVEAEDLDVVLGRGRSRTHAVVGVSLSIAQGEVFGVIGESGSGKTSLGLAVAGLVPVSGGRLSFPAAASAGATAEAARRRRVQMIFQDPLRALNPQVAVWKSVAEPMAPRRFRIPVSFRAPAIEALNEVGLHAHEADRLPSQLSGGQRQRATIARALASRAPLIVCDEPVASLDASIQADVLNLLAALRVEHGLTYVFISHDLNSVAGLATRVAVMYLGRIVEEGDVEDVFSNSAHPYTKALIATTPRVQRRIGVRRPQATILGEIPDARRPPSGCRFRTRCPHAREQCEEREPLLEEIPGTRPAHRVACHFWRELRGLDAAGGDRVSRIDPGDGQGGAP